MRQLTYFVAVSQDGYIAGPAGETDRFEQGPALIEYLAEHYPETLPTPARHHLGISGGPHHFDAVLMGRSTYQVGVDQGVTNPYAHLDRQIVASRSNASGVDAAIEIAADPVAVVRELKASDGMAIWLCGGGLLAGTLLDQIDELIVKRQPIALGDGVPMFSGTYRPARFEPVDREMVGAVAIERYRRAVDGVSERISQVETSGGVATSAGVGSSG